jgi:UDP-N-acetyl-D-glucosamine dehydrogenase
MTQNRPVQPLLDAIQNRTATVGVIGLGYVGLPLVLLFAENGFQVIGFDVDQKKVDALDRGESYIRHIGSDRVASVFKSGRAVATVDYERLAECDAILICVPTPLGHHREPDLKYVRMTAEAIAKRLRKGQLVILESSS